MSASMNVIKERLSPTLFETQAQGCPRRGVETREEVLKQLTITSDVVVLGSDDEEPNQDLPTSPDRLNTPGVKRKLFTSANARENMYRASGLPSPPSDDNSPQPTLCDNPNLPTWALSVPTYETSDIWTEKEEDGHVLSIQLAQLINRPASTEGTIDVSSTKTTTARDAPVKVKFAMEANAIERSQKLRAKNRTEEANSLFADGQVSDDSTAHNVSASTMDISPKTRKLNDGSRHRIGATLPAKTNLNNDEDIERQLDDALQLMKNDQTPTQIVPCKNNRQLLLRHRQGANPYSTRAAESFRTQSRHLNRNTEESDDNFYSTSSIGQDNTQTGLHERERAEARLLRIQTNALANSFAPKPRTKVKFHAPDTGNSSPLEKNKPVPDQKQKQRSIRDLMGTANQGRCNNAQDDRDELNVEGPKNQATSSYIDRPMSLLSVLEQLSVGVATSTRDTHSKPAVLDVFELLPEQGTDLNLPKRFEALTEYRKTRITRREVLKERDRDFDTIISVFKMFATFLAVDSNLPRSYIGRLEEVKRFTEAVLDKGRSGKRARKRINDISVSIRRRLDAIGYVPDPRTIDEKLSDLMLPKYAERLQAERPGLQAELSIVKEECRETKEDYKNDQRRRKRQATDKAILKVKSSSRLDTAHETYCRSVDRRIKEKQSQLALFDDVEKTVIDEQRSDLEVIDPALSRDDREGAISEEDEGEDLMLPRGIDGQVQHMSHANEKGKADRLTKQTQEVQGVVDARPVQAANQSLLEKMAARAEQQRHSIRQGAQKFDTQMLQDMRQREVGRGVAKDQPGDLEEDNEVSTSNANTEVGSSNEFDDSDVDQDDEESDGDKEDNEEQPVCKRYIVKTYITGLGLEYEGAEQQLGKFLNKKKATRKVLEVAPWARKVFEMQRPDTASTAYSITTKDQEGEYEQQITLGDSSAVGCRTWIEHEMYNPSEEAYNNAKVYKACQPPDIWFVDSERVLKQLKGGDEDGHLMSGTRTVTAEDEDLQNAAMDLTKEAAHTSIEAATSNQDESSEFQQDGAACPDPSSITTEEDDDLFGPDVEPAQSTQPTSVSSPAPSNNSESLPVVTRTTGDQFRFFTSLALVNRHAKEVFMHWFIGHLPGPNNFDFIRDKDTELEEELRQIGNRAAWQKTDDFDTMGADGLERNESFRVWVRKARGVGPSN